MVNLVLRISHLSTTLRNHSTYAFTVKIRSEKHKDTGGGGKNTAWGWVGAPKLKTDLSLFCKSVSFSLHPLRSLPLRPQFLLKEEPGRRIPPGALHRERDSRFLWGLLISLLTTSVCLESRTVTSCLSSRSKVFVKLLVGSAFSPSFTWACQPPILGPTPTMHRHTHHTPSPHTPHAHHTHHTHHTHTTHHIHHTHTHHTPSPHTPHTHHTHTPHRHPPHTPHTQSQTHTPHTHTAVYLPS